VTPAGIYIHIPYCRTKCTYCAFNSGDYDSVQGSQYVGALCREIELSDKSIAGKNVDSIFFGGGTPSILPAQELISVLNACRANFDVSKDTEITVEINPGTITPEKVAAYRKAGINRASLGVQSFIDRELTFIGRIHSAEDARTSVKMLRDGGFENISIDLIAGLPYQTIDDWRFNVSEALKLQTDHVSVYMLEVHEGTSLFHQVNRGEVARPDDELSVQMYYELIDAAAEADLAQYEISNFACGPEYRSRHNLKYWSDVPYYGFGCGAHAYDGQSRWWNVKPPKQYIELILTTGKAISEITPLSERELMQEAIFLGLRRMSGIDLTYFQETYGVDIVSEYKDDLDKFLEAKVLEIDGDTIRLTREGLALSNEVFAVFV